MRDTVIVLTFFVLTATLADGADFPHVFVGVRGAEFLLTNPQGKREGYSSPGNRPFREINNSYGWEGPFDVDPESEVVPEFTFDDREATFGGYQVLIRGTRPIVYSAVLSAFRMEGGTDGEGMEICGIIDSGFSNSIQFDLNTAAYTPFNFRKVVGLELLRQDVELSRKIGFIKDTVVAGDLLAVLNSYSSFSRNGDTAGSNNSMDEFVSIARNQKGVTIDSIVADVLVADALQLKAAKPPVAMKLQVPGGYHTIQEAVDRARSGDIVEVSSGKYDEIVRLEGKESLVLLAGGPSRQAHVKGFTLSRCRGVTISGFFVDATGTARNGISCLGGTGANSDIAIEANEIKNAGKDLSGILIEPGNTQIRIVNNLIHSNGRDGIAVANSTTGRTYVMNNTVVRNGGNGLSIGAQDTIYVVNNIISFNGTRGDVSTGRYGILTEQGGSTPSAITLLYNLIARNNGGSSQASSQDIGHFAQMLDSTDAGNITTTGAEGMGISASTSAVFNSIFVSEVPFDLHLKAGSIAIDQCPTWYSRPDVQAGEVPTVDFWGVGRPQGKKVDMGGGEFTK